MQSQQLPTESQVFEDEVLPGTESADHPAEEMSERRDHGKNLIGKVRIELCAKSFILQVHDVLARHSFLNPASVFGRFNRALTRSTILQSFTNTVPIKFRVLADLASSTNSRNSLVSFAIV